MGPAVVPEFTYAQRPMDGDQVGDYRKYVGPPDNYDLMSGIQFSLLFALGLREAHRLADVGCGSLRAGRLFIPYLAPGNYHGLEPNRWLVEEGIARELGASAIEIKAPKFAHNDTFDLSSFDTEFDFVLAQSIFSHTFSDLTASAFGSIGASLAPDGLFVATYYPRRRYAPANKLAPEAGKGFLHPGVVGYRWPQIARLLDDAGLVGHRIAWLHPHQTWFVAARKGHEEVLGRAIANTGSALRALPRRDHARRDVEITTRQWRNAWRGRLRRLALRTK